jgi:hypothetical protein
MNPAKPSASPQFRSGLFAVLATGLTLLFCSGLGYVAYAIIRGPYVDHMTWHYEDFHVAGYPSRPSSLNAEGVPPQKIVVERQKDGQRVELSTITWDSANAMSSNKPSSLSSGEDLIEMFDETGYGSCYLTVTFENGIFKSLSAHGVRIHNTANGQSLLLANWSEVERVFGKPENKEKSRHYVSWGR